MLELKDYQKEAVRKLKENIVNSRGLSPRVPRKIFETNDG